MATATSEVPNDLAQRRKDPEEWDCGPMEIAVTTSLTDHTLVNINFTETLGHGRHVPRAGKRDDDNCYWLRPEWNDQSEYTREKNIYPLFINAAKKAGFKMRGTWEKNHSKIKFTCHRYRRNDKHANQVAAAKRRLSKQLKKPFNPPIKRARKSERPIRLTEEQRNDPSMQGEWDDSDLMTCKVSFGVFWDNAKSRWFIPKQQAGCKRHTGHQYVDPSLIRLHPRHTLPLEEISVAETDRSTSVIFDNGTATDKVGGNPVFQQGSDCMVPSQQTQTETDSQRATLPVNSYQNQTHSVQYAETLQMLAQGSNLKSDFMPMYETLCNFTQSAGEEGRLALKNDFNLLRNKQIELIAKQKAASSDPQDVRSEFMHIYQNVCELASEAGIDGRLLLRDGLNAMKKKQAGIIANQNGLFRRTFASMPVTSINDKGKRSNQGASQTGDRHY